MRPITLLGTLVACILLLPGIASSQTVTRTYGLGNVNEPLCPVQADGCEIYVSTDSDPGDPAANCPEPTPTGECAARNENLISSALVIQSDPLFPIYPVPGTIVVEEDTVAGTVLIPVGSRSAHANISILPLDLPFVGNTFVITTGAQFVYDGATGVGSPTTQISWNNPVPYAIEGCLVCVSGSGDGCDSIGLGPDGAVICGPNIQPGDPQMRDMPDWISNDGGRTWQMPDNGDDHFDQDEGIPSSSFDIGLERNGGAWVFRGFLERECGTTNPPDELDPNAPFDPRHGRPDPDCDGTAEYTYGLGNVDVPACDDLSGDGVCQTLLNTDSDGSPFVPDCASPTPNGFCVIRSGSLDVAQCTADRTPFVCCTGPGTGNCIVEPVLASIDQIQSDPTFPVPTSPGTIHIEEDPVAQTVSVPLGSRSGWVDNNIFDLDLGFAQILLVAANGHLIDGATGVGSPVNQIDWDPPCPDPGPGNCAPWQGYGCTQCFDVTPGVCSLFGLGENGTVLCGDEIQVGDPRERDYPLWIGGIPLDALTPRGDTWEFPDDGDEFFDATESIKANAPDLGSATNGAGIRWKGFLRRECTVTDEPAVLPAPPGNGQPDRDCDTLHDGEDVCPDYVQTATGTPGPGSDANRDTDGNGRGDLCECGDQTGDGSIDIGDILAVTAAIFDPSLVTPLCDANHDGRCNIQDILAINAQIFADDIITTCYRWPVNRL